MRRLVIALLLGCSQKITYLESPPLSSAQTFVVLVREPEAPLRISVTAATAFELVLEQPSSNEVDVTVVGLSPSLDELGLTEGPLPEVEQGVPLSAIARTGVVQAMFSGDAWSGWLEEMELPGEVADARIPRKGCAQAIDSSLETFDRDAPVAIAAAKDDDSALIVVGSRAVIWKPVRGIVQSVELPDLFIGGVLDMERGLAYLGSRTVPAIHTISSQTLELTFTASTSEADVGLMRWMDYDGDYLVALSTSGILFRRNGPVLENVAALEVAGPNTDAGAVFVLEPDQVLLGADNNHDLHRYDGNGLVTEITGPFDSKGFVTLAEVPSLGVVTVELLSGQIFSRTGGDWAQIGRGLMDARIIHPLSEGRFLMSDSYGQWSELHPIHGTGCGVVESSVLIEVQGMFQIGASVYGVGRGQSGAIEIAHLAQIE